MVGLIYSDDVTSDDGREFSDRNPKPQELTIKRGEVSTEIKCGWVGVKPGMSYPSVGIIHCTVDSYGVNLSAAASLSKEGMAALKIVMRTAEYIHQTEY